MPNLAVNYGSVAASAKQYHKAINIYLAALAGNPGAQLLSGALNTSSASSATMIP